MSIAYEKYPCASSVNGMLNGKILSLMIIETRPIKDSEKITFFVKISDFFSKASVICSILNKLFD